MAIIDSVALGKARKSIGNVTLRKRGDIVIASQKVSHCNVIGTYAQVARRVHFANILNAYRSLSQVLVMKTCFPKATDTRSAYSEFIRLNMTDADVSAVALTKSEAAQSFLCPAPFIVSDGTLGNLNDLSQYMEGGHIWLQSSVANMGDVSRALLNIGSALQNGDRVVFVVMCCDAVTRFDSASIVINVDSRDPLPSWISHDGKFVFSDIGESAELTSHAALHFRGNEVSFAQLSAECMDGESYVLHSSDAHLEDAINSYGFR